MRNYVKWQMLNTKMYKEFDRFVWEMKPEKILIMAKQDITTADGSMNEMLGVWRSMRSNIY